MTIGILAAPGLSTRLIESLTGELGRLLHAHVDNRCDWDVVTVTDPLVGAKSNTTHIMAKAAELKEEHCWHYVVCVTDLPMYHRRRLMVAEASAHHSAAVLSLPTLGALYLRRRLREAFVQLVNELHHGSDDEVRERQQTHASRQRRHGRRHGLRNLHARALLAKRLTERLSPIHRERVEDDAREIDVRFISSARVRGSCKLLSGMIRANRPWSIVPTFRRVLAVAFATGAYGLIFHTLWSLSGAYQLPRFLFLMVASITAMVAWLIIDHDLWAHRYQLGLKARVRVYNLTTVITLLTGVICYYAILFLLFLVTVILLAPPDLLAKVQGNETTWYDYPLLAWLGTSVATIAGALGGSLESDETVRNATYGHRERARYRQARDATQFQTDGDDS